MSHHHLFILWTIIVFFSFTPVNMIYSHSSIDTIYWQAEVKQLNRQSTCCYNEGEFKAAKYLNSIAYQSAKDCLGGETTQYSSALHNLAIFLDLEGKNEEAIVIFQKVKDIEERLGGSADDLSIIYNSIGYAYRTIGDYHTALKYFDQAIQLRKKAAIVDNYLVTFLSDKTLCLMDLGLLDDARENSQNSLDLIDCLEEKDSDFVQQVALYCHQNLAAIALEQATPTSDIRKHLDQAIDILKTSKPGQKAYYTYELKGKLYQQQHQYKKAHANYKKAEKLLKKELEKGNVKKDVRLGQLCTQRAIAYREQAKLKKALKCHQKALKAIAVEEDLDINSFDNPKKNQFINKLHAIEILAAKAQTLTILGDLEAAYQTYQLATGLVPATRRSYKEKGAKYQLAGTTVTLYEAAIDIAIRLFEKTKNPMYKEQAFVFSESNKGVLLLEDMLQKSVQQKAEELIPATLLKEEQALRHRINRLEQELFGLKSKSNSTDTDLEKQTKGLETSLFDFKEQYNNELQEKLKQYPKYWSLRYEQAPLSIEVVREKIIKGSQTALLEFFVGEEAIYLFFITPEDFKIQKIDKTIDFEKNITTLQSIVSNPSPEYMDLLHQQYQDFSDASHCLYEMLLSKVLDATTVNLEQLIIIPDGILHHIPMDILLQSPVDTHSSHYHIAFNDYLFERFALSYHYSSQLFLFNQQDNRNEGGFVGLAPIFDNKLQQNKLKNAPKEIEAIANMMDGRAYHNAHIGFETLKNKASTASILHIATHAQSGETNDQLPQIFLSKDAVTYYDLENIHFNTDLVVLSACETGSGQVIKGEGAMTLARSIIRSGSPSVIATAWSIDDGVTANLMINFYKNLKKGWTKDKALQTAKLQYLQNGNPYTHPYFWAAFQQYGDSKAINMPESENNMNIQHYSFLFSLMTLFFYGVFL